MSEANPELQKEVAGLIVSVLNLDINPDDIQPDAPLYGEGLGLDSIDILDVALVVSKHVGYQLRADNADNVRIFSSLANLARHIAANRTSWGSAPDGWSKVPLRPSPCGRGGVGFGSRWGIGRQEMRGIA